MTTNPANAKGSWFGRDPATLVGMINAAVLSLLAVLVTDNVIAGAVGAVVTAISAAIIAFAVRRDGQLAAIVGIGRTIVALTVLLGVHWDPAYQVVLLVAIEAVASIFVRDRVEAKVPASATVRGPALREAA